MASLRVLASSALLVAAALAAPPAAADGPRPVTAAEAATPTCFGASADTAYAVRVKITCDPATAKCESASYLSRVDWSGRATTAAYLTYLKGEGRPTAPQLAATAKPDGVAKAQAAMADATMECGSAAVGQSFAYDGGKRKASITAEPSGGWRVRGDNARSIVVTAEALLWVSGSSHWYGVRTTTTPDGTLTDTTFEPVDASSLFLPAPQPASPKAVGITHANIGQPSCRGFVSASQTFLVTVPVAESGSGVARLLEVTPDTVARKTLVSRPLPPFITDPMVALAGASPDDLALANDRLASVDASCAEVGVTAKTDQTVTLGGQPVTVALKDGVLTFTGPRGARRRVDVAGGAKTVWLYVTDDARARHAQALIGERDGGEHVAVEIAPLLAEPELFPLPAKLGEPLCMSDGIRFFLEVVTRKVGGATEPTKLEVFDFIDRKHPKSLAVLASADLAPGAAPDALLTAVDRNARIKLVEDLGKVDPCAVEPMPADLAWPLGDGKVTLALDGAQWKAKRADGKTIVLGTQADLGTPRWILPPRGSGGPQTIVFARDDGSPPMMVAPTADDFDRAPDPSDVAMKAPKLLKDRVPDSNQKRCLAWNSKDLSAWIARPTASCSTCAEQVVLTEVRKDGYYKRVTLAQDGSAWTHMFDHANGFISKADLGCIDDADITVLGVPVKVETDDKARFVVSANDKKTKADGLKTVDDDGMSRTESINAIFWHPSVPALIIEVSVSREDGGMDMRYVWVDLGKVGVKAAK